MSFGKPILTGDITGLGTARLLEAIRLYNPKIKFYFAGTSELFGGIKTTPQNEETPFHPTSPYGVAKLYSYWMTKFYREAYGMFCCNGILFNHESQRRGLNFVTRKITSTVADIQKGNKEELVLGNLYAKKDWSHAKDMVKGMWLMLQQDKPDDYILGSGIVHTVKDFVEASFEAVNKKIVWEGKELNEVGKIDGKIVVKISKDFYRPLDTLPFIADPSKAKKVLGWEPEIDFKELVKIMVENDLKG